MEKATRMQDLLRGFKVEPLKGTDLDKFRVDTYKARGTNSARILCDYFEINQEDSKKVLFIGHRGAGKSTELYQLGEYLKDNFSIINFSIKKEIGIWGMQYTDLMFVMFYKLFEKAVEEGVKIDGVLLDNLYNYWCDERLKEIYKIEKEEIKVSAEVKLDFVARILPAVKGVLATGKESRDTVRRHMEPRLSQLLESAGDLICRLRMELNKKGKTPLMVITDLDKLNIPDAKELFLNHSDVLTGFEIHIVYTFPSLLKYTAEYNEIKDAFDHAELLSMIKVNDRDGKPYEMGRSIIREIVAKRANLELFDPKALEFIIEKSGGALRDIFEMILKAALLARSRDINASRVDLESAREAYYELRSDFERMIFKRHIDVLKRVYDNDAKDSLADENMMEMMYCSAVMEYDGMRWYGLHPAVRDLLERKGLV